ncbi:MAG: hypothetical protein AAF587_20780 [Bacteroidota bacterium]
MADSTNSQDLNITAVITDPTPSGDSSDDRSAPSNVPDYGIKLADVVLNSDQLKVVLDTTDSQEPPSTSKPYQKLDVVISFQELPDGEVFILSTAHIPQLNHPKMDIDLSLIDPAIPEADKDYKIEVSVSGKNHEGELIQFNSTPGGTTFVKDKTVNLSTN